MKIFGASTALLLIFVYAFAFPVDDSEKEKTVVKAIVAGLEHSHFTDWSLNDELSEKAFDQYLSRIDAQKKFFLQEDLTRMEVFKKEIDDQISKGDLTLLDVSLDILERRIGEAQGYYQEILSSPFDLTASEVVETDEEKFDHARTKEELKEIWRRSLKYQVVARMADKLVAQEKDLKRQEEKAAGMTDEKKMTDGEEEMKEDEEPVVIKTIAELEIEAREKVLSRHDSWFKRIEKLNREDRFATYINSVIGVLDPHTGYFPPKKKEDFDISISGRLEGIGARLTTEDNGYIKVIEIVPGSPSSLQGELEPEDLILKVAQADEEPVDVVDMRLDDAVQLIRGKKGTEVRLTVKKLDGSTKVIPIIRDIVINEESYAKTAVIKDEQNNEAVGMVYLPKFYTDFTKTGGRTCSEDVRKEIEKLNDEGIDKMILDLRGNGGGSLQDVVDMVGLFIDRGPVVQVKSREGYPYVLEDKDPEVQFDGELVVMVDNFSASASEIFAAAIQDYDRGTIVGSASTYGKGTVQRFYDLDRYVRSPSASALKPLGSLKVTTQKFYRVNGGATQLKGVQSDIVYPDTYSYIDIGEKELDYAMPWSEISSVSYNSWDETDMVSLDRSEMIRSDENFQKMDEYAQIFKERRDRTSYPLNFEEYLTYKKEIDEISEKYKDLNSVKIEGLMVSSLKADAMAIGDDEVKIDRRDSWFEKLEEDIYLKEAVSILTSVN